MIQRLLFTLILMNLLSGMCYGQENTQVVTLSGYIKDYSYKSTLPAAIVSAGDQVTQTDQSGKFTLKVSRGQIHLSCIYIGYQRIDTVLNINSDTRIDLFLKSDKT